MQGLRKILSHRGGGFLIRRMWTGISTSARSSWRPAFNPTIPASYGAYNYTKLPNVITGMEFERILAAAGPFSGHMVRPSDHKEPTKIAWLQCVGLPGSESLRQQLLLGGVLHVCHQRGDHRQGA